MASAASICFLGDVAHRSSALILDNSGRSARYRRANRACRDDMTTYKRRGRSCKASVERNRSMSWNNPGGGGGGPWGGGGSGPWGGRRRRPRRSAARFRGTRCAAAQDRLRSLLPGGWGAAAASSLVAGGGGRRSGSPAASIASSPTSRASCCASAPSTATASPGLNYHLPVADRRGADAEGDARQPHRDRLSRVATTGTAAAYRRAGRIADADRRREHRRHQLHRVLADQGCARIISSTSAIPNGR